MVRRVLFPEQPITPSVGTWDACGGSTLDEAAEKEEHNLLAGFFILHSVSSDQTPALRGKFHIHWSAENHAKDRSARTW